MKNTAHEPQPPAPRLRPCSTPHPGGAAQLSVPGAASPASTADDREALIAAVLADPDLLAEIASRGAPRGSARHDGWTGERIAAFLEVLADTGIVTEACRAAGMSRDSAYSLRNRDPVFAAALRAAQLKARPHVADGILERSITGTVEHYYRDGVLVGERRHYESWLALAVLQRLDKQAAEDRAEGSLSARIGGEWQGTLDAFRNGGTEAARAFLQAETDKADTLPLPPDPDPAENCWQSDEGKWMTTFPPPPGFDGYESCEWDGLKWYERACTAEEAELLDAHQAGAQAEEYAELTAFAEAERDEWFENLRTELASLVVKNKAGPGSRPG
jgi:hypothetical protein